MKSFFLTIASLVIAGYSSTLVASVPSVTSAEQWLENRLNMLLSTPYHQSSEPVRTVSLLASRAQMAAVCERPKLSLSGDVSRLAGKRIAIATCGKRKHYLPIRISAHGTWWTARHNLKGGAILRHGDIQSVNGTMDDQPQGLILEAEAIIGQRLTRAVEAGKPLLKNQLRQQWRLHAGDKVVIVTKGNGYRIRSEGKALNNAPVDGILKVQTRNGQRLQGKVGTDGQVMIFLQD